ncbi:MAG: putative selenate reductase subunit YgfK [Lentimicrobiaceae bacterium]|nr:putative selenate reductase subunit YgfK [Lentimicrobiaceae bacterium]
MKQDKFSVVPLEHLLHLILEQLKNVQYFGLDKGLFYTGSEPAFQSKRFGQLLETPLGVAAGPHTQMAQNIIGAWLCGARFIELKTIQTLDELDVSKPCIDMYDEGYNCEWSQELKIKESFDQYLNAWIIIHTLTPPNLPEGEAFPPSGGQRGVFNMSVGYNYEGILNENVQWFFDKMRDCHAEKQEKINAIRKIYPLIDEIAIPDCISNNVTLSTMHGCPPQEIEKIGLYLIEEKGLHTTIKLNPTLLGPDRLRRILNDTLGYSTPVPDLAFEHDLKYPDALNIIRNLSLAAKKKNVHFAIKLTNTLESQNFRNVFPENEKMMYMSGKALHPISINLAHKLQQDFGGKLDISFSAGADCFNFADILACGLKPVTVCSDILKPGGYGRLSQYLENLKEEMYRLSANSLDDFILKKTENAFTDVSEAALHNLEKYSAEALSNPVYRKGHLPKDIKTRRPLGYFDCVHAPCVDTCPANQDIPEYMYLTSEGRFEEAFHMILRTNPFPTVTGMACDHLCQTKCTRMNYEEALQIREIKRFVSEQAGEKTVPATLPSNGLKAAILGAGPAGLSCAWFLRLSGFEVDVFEERAYAGGMVASVIPSFRMPGAGIEKDIERIVDAGVKIHFETPVTGETFEKLQRDYDYVFVATGAKKAKRLNIPGEDLPAVTDPLAFLSLAKQEKVLSTGNHVIVIGGGNTAMDAARMAKKIAGENGNVTIVYRRTLAEMPAAYEEVEAALREGVEILTLTAPLQITESVPGKVLLHCQKMELKGVDEKGRPKPVRIEGSGFDLEASMIIPAVGQDVVIDFMNPYFTVNNPEFLTKLPNVFIGGDALRGASSIIRAIGDGQKTARLIVAQAGKQFPVIAPVINKDIDFCQLTVKKARKVKPVIVPAGEKPYAIPPAFTVEQAKTEASRCLSCDEVCNVCVSVCPNFANYGYQTEPLTFMLKKITKKDDKITLEDDKIFRVQQRFQILNIGDFCNECGNCNTFCPSNGAPYKDKPKFYLTIKSFNEAETGYFLSKLSDKKVLIYKEKQKIRTLTFNENQYRYETDEWAATFMLPDFTPSDIVFKVPCLVTASSELAAEMFILMKAVEKLY